MALCLCEFLRKALKGRRFSFLPPSPPSSQPQELEGQASLPKSLEDPRKPSLRFPFLPLRRAEQDEASLPLGDAISALNIFLDAGFSSPCALESSLALLVVALLLGSRQPLSLAELESAFKTLLRAKRCRAEGSVTRRHSKRPGGFGEAAFSKNLAFHDEALALVLPLAVARVVGTDFGSWAETEATRLRLEVLRAYAASLRSLVERDSSAARRNSEAEDARALAEGELRFPFWRDVEKTASAFALEEGVRWLETLEAAEVSETLRAAAEGEAQGGIAARTEALRLRLLLFGPVSLECARLLRRNSVASLSSPQCRRLLSTLALLLELSQSLGYPNGALDAPPWRRLLVSTKAAGFAVEERRSAADRFSLKEKRAADCNSPLLLPLVQMANALLQRLALALPREGTPSSDASLSAREAVGLAREAVRFLEWRTLKPGEETVCLGDACHRALWQSASRTVAASAFFCTQRLEALSPRDFSTLLCAAAKTASLCRRELQSAFREKALSSGEDAFSRGTAEIPSCSERLSLATALKALFEKAMKVLLLPQANERHLQGGSIEDAYAALEISAALQRAPPEEVSLILWAILIWQRFSESADEEAVALCLAAMASAVHKRLCERRVLLTSSSAMALLALALRTDATTRKLHLAAKGDSPAAALLRLCSERLLSEMRRELREPPSQRVSSRSLQREALVRRRGRRRGTRGFAVWSLFAVLIGGSASHGLGSSARRLSFRSRSRRLRFSRPRPSLCGERLFDAAARGALRGNTAALSALQGRGASRSASASLAKHA